jgi:hypothetical protein
MSEEKVVGLGQRELVPGGLFEPTADEQVVLDAANLSAVAVQSFVDAEGAQTINAAIGGLQSKLKHDAEHKESAAVEATPE